MDDQPTPDEVKTVFQAMTTYHPEIVPGEGDWSTIVGDANGVKRAGGTFGMPKASRE